MSKSVMYWTRLEVEKAAWTFLVADDQLVRILYPGDAPENWIAWIQRIKPGAELQKNHEAVSRLGILDLWQAYFEGKPVSFVDVPLFESGTPFQQEVWSMLRQIPYGSVWSYGKLAGAIGRPRAVRAVGAANGANPLPVIVPCHRVIGADRRLTGYRGGLSMKETLLRLEGADSFASAGHARFQF